METADSVQDLAADIEIISNEMNENQAIAEDLRKKLRFLSGFRRKAQWIIKQRMS